MKKYFEPEFEVRLIEELDVLEVSPLEQGEIDGVDPWATDIYL